MITRASDVQLPSDVDCEHNVEGRDGSFSKKLIPGVPMFCLSIKLLNVLHDILEAVYVGSQSDVSNRFRSRDVELLGESLKLNHQLDEFLNLLPRRLRRFITKSSSTTGDLACNFSLHEQALVTRLVLPSFTAALLLRLFTTPPALTIPDSCMRG